MRYDYFDIILRFHPFLRYDYFEIILRFHPFFPDVLKLLVKDSSWDRVLQQVAMR
eukprot:SAG11_NODE_36720_length_260_cov_0.645963_1_plen_54_part_10